MRTSEFTHTPAASSKRVSGFRLIANLLVLAVAQMGVSSLHGQSGDYTFTTIGGVASKPGSKDGTGGGSNLPLFNLPMGLVMNSSGNLYVTDSSNRMIRTVKPDGTVTTFAGTPGLAGSTDGTGVDTGVSFGSPQGCALDSSGNLYIADYTSATIRKITPAGVVTTIAGALGYRGSNNGTGTAATFTSPSGIAVDNSGNIYVSDSTTHEIRKITSAGVVTTLAGTAGSSGSVDGDGAAARFNKPRGLVTDSAGNLYVADYNNNTIRKITPSGTVSTFAGSAGLFGSTDGASTVAKFNFPHGLSIDSSGNLYVADSANNTIRKITSSGQVSTLAGSAGVGTGLADGTGSAARFNTPTDVATDSAGNVYVADYNNHLIRKVSAAGVVTTVAGVGNTTGFLDGKGYILSPALLNNPSGTAVDSAGNVFVADTGNNMIRKIAPAGAITTYAGSINAFGRTDGDAASASFTNPTDAALDASGNLYIADTANHSIRKITPAGVVSTLAGTAGTAGSADHNTGTSATFNYPSSVAVDASGNIYVADYNNHTIRKVTAAGAVTTFAGSAGAAGSADGVAGSARFKYPRSVGVDASGNVYVADSGNNTVRKISSGGVVQTLAGSAGNAGKVDGTGATARFDGPAGIAVDAAGNAYVSDSNNNTIRKVTVGGVVTTLGGTAGSVGNRDGVATDARFDHPTGLTVDSVGILYIADSRNHTIRRGVPASAPTSGTGAGSSSSSTTTGSNTSGTGGSSDTSGSTGTGSGSGSGSSGSGTGTGFLLQPAGIAAGSGAYYVSDTANNSIKLVTLANVVSVLTGKDGTAGSNDGKLADARFNGPTGITADGLGNLYICDTGNGTIRKIATTGDVTTFAGSTSTRGSTDGTGTAALFASPNGIVYSSATGNLYVSDPVNSTIRMITSAGVVTTVAGTAKTVGDRDGLGTQALFNNPTGLAVDSGGNLYVADSFNNTIRKITTAKRFITATAAGTITAAGTATVVLTDSALTGSPITLNVEVAVDDTPALWAIKVATALAANTTIAARYSPSSNGDFIYLNYLTTVDDTVIANLSLANGTCAGITAAPTSKAGVPAGTVTTLAGSAGISGAYDGKGIYGLFNRPTGLTIDSSGNLYVADSGNSSIRLVSGNGSVFTIAGIAGISGKRDGAGASALFNQPQALVLGTSGMVVADTGNSILRSVSYSTTSLAYSVATVALTAPDTSTSTSTTTTTTTSSSSGGGGAPSLWFLAGLSLLGLGRNWLRKRE